MRLKCFRKSQSEVEYPLHTRMRPDAFCQPITAEGCPLLILYGATSGRSRGFKFISIRSDDMTAIGVDAKLIQEPFADRKERFSRPLQGGAYSDTRQGVLWNRLWRCFYLASFQLDVFAKIAKPGRILQSGMFVLISHFLQLS